MLTFDMNIEILILFIGLRSGHSANKAQCLHIFDDLLFAVSQLSKGVDHNTRHNITEQQFHHHNVDQTCDEFPELKGLHLLADGSRNVYGQDAVDNGVAALLIRWD
jgi:hypothetical protein